MTGILNGPGTRSGQLRIAVFRALNLGDLLCFIPAMRALRSAFPDARISLIGLESARPIVARFPHYFDELVIFPGDPLFPEQGVRKAELPGFYRQMQQRRFDLALQMHGSGGRSNAIVSRLCAGTWGGFVPDAAGAEPGRLMPWPDDLPETFRYLSLLKHLGLDLTLDSATARMELPLLQGDVEEAQALIDSSGLDVSRMVVIHPGARLSSRRWPVRRYARVARELADEGWQLVLTGSQDENTLVSELERLAERPALNLCASTSLGGMAALLSQARLLICNDTGVSHIAAAVGAPSVVIACGSDVARWGPQDRSLHSVLYADTDCRPCSWHHCPFAGHPCAGAVHVDEVLLKARSKLTSEVLA